MHVLSVEFLAGLPPIRKRISFLNERFLVSALVKPNDGETRRAPSNLEQFKLPPRMADGIKNALSYGVRPSLGGFDNCA
jgi:hypothetical protein